MLPKDILITVIIPVFNSEKYLSRCLDSVLGQTYSNLQVIAVDDGSTDRSPKILDDYAEKDSRLVVMHKNTNEGLSLARNDALQISRGEYIAFVDSDDYICLDMYEKLLSCMIEQGVKIVLCQWQWQRKDGSMPEMVIPNDICGKLNSIELQRYSCRGGYVNGVVCAPWNKLYDKEVLQEVSFDGPYAEDEGLNDKINSRNYEVFVLPDLLYFYCDNPDSMTHAEFSLKRIYFLDILEKRMELFQFDDYILNHTRQLYCNLYIEYYYKLRALKEDFPPHYKECFRKTRKGVKGNIKFRIRMVLFAINPTLYQVVIK